MEQSKNFFANFYQTISSRWQLFALFNLVILVSILYIIYRYIFSEKGIWIREKFSWLKKVSVQKYVSQYLKDGEYAKAGDTLVSMKRYKEAIKVFTDGRLYGRAADVYLMRNQLEHAANLYEMAQDYNKASELYVQTKSFEKAEECLKKLDRESEIPKIYLSHNLKSLAAQAMVRLGQFNEAAALFTEDGDFAKAGEMIESLYLKEKNRLSQDGNFPDDTKLKQMVKIGGEYLIKAKRFDRAAKFFLKEKMFDEAGTSYELAGNSDKAVELFIKSGKFQKAAAILRDKGDLKRAAFIEAEACSQSGDDQNAVKYYQEAGDFAKAGDIYRNLQEFEKAGIMFEKAREFSLAASAYADAKIFDKAAVCSEKVKDYDKAIDFYGHAKDYAKQVALQEKLSKFFGAGLNYYNRGLNEEALSTLEKVESDSPDYNQAMALIGKIYMERGELSKAKEKLEKAVSGMKQISKNNIDTFAHLAMLAEQSESEPSILKTIEKMLAQDLVDRDVKEKVDSLRQKLNYFAISRLSKMASKEGMSRFADPQINVSNVAKLEKKRYIKIKEIGRGGMGIVYTARDSTLDRIVALKILPSSLKKNPQAIKTFLREAKSAAALNHPNIVTIYDAGLEDDDYYIAMELINGLTIKEILRKSKRLSIKSVLEVLRQLLQGLSYAHKNNIVHRDLTTNNIMWSKEKVIKVMDFGLAKVVKDLLSEQSIIGGTPSFMSPEQTLGKPIDHRTDLYSLGICLFQMLIGELPFKKGDLGYHHLHTIPPAPNSIDKSIPQPLNDIILKCLEKDPINRFQAAEEIENILNTQLADFTK